jgi:hypothetical protein
VRTPATLIARLINAAGQLKDAYLAAHGRLAIPRHEVGICRIESGP